MFILDNLDNLDYNDNITTEMSKQDSLESNSSLYSDIISSTCNLQLSQTQLLEEERFDIHNYIDSPLKTSIDDFKLLSVIGKGAYGKVYLVKKIPQNHQQSEPPTLYAMKVLKKATIIVHGKDTEHTRNERSILQDIQHPFIVKLHYAFQTPEKLYLILTYACGGELFSYLVKEKMFSEDTACFYISEILLTLDHLHHLGIIYRDLKPENVLLSADGHICLTDFGLSKVALEASTVCGTPEFTAPEILHECGVYDKVVDYWSLGVMLYDMLTGSPPFTGHNRKKIMESIIKKKPIYPKYLTNQAKDLCTKLLKKNPTQRLGVLGADSVKKHAFFSKIDWVKLLDKKVKPPFVPELNHEEDTCYFTDSFTKMPMESPPSINQGLDDNYCKGEFHGFSFEASKSTLNDRFLDKSN